MQESKMKPRKSKNGFYQQARIQQVFGNIGSCSSAHQSRKDKRRRKMGRFKGLKIKLPTCGETLTKTMLITQKHNSIKKLFDQNFWKNF